MFGIFWPRGLRRQAAGIVWFLNPFSTVQEADLKRPHTQALGSNSCVIYTRGGNKWTKFTFPIIRPRYLDAMFPVTFVRGGGGDI